MQYGFDAILSPQKTLYYPALSQSVRKTLFPADTNVLTERRKRDQHLGSLFPNYKKNFLSAASTFFLTAFPFATEDLTRITLVFFFPFKIFLP